jgi:hypothetical protein
LHEGADGQIEPELVGVQANSEGVINGFVEGEEFWVADG